MSAAKPARKKTHAISELVGKVMEPVLARRSGMTMDLRAAWPELVGEGYADFTRPEKIKWPNRAHEDDPFKPGILIVACAGSHALFLQHDLPQICSRINVFFGYSAIEKINIVQKLVTSGKSKKQTAAIKLNDADVSRLNKILTRVDDPKLREKLETLGQGVIGKQKVKHTSK